MLVALLAEFSKEGLGLAGTVLDTLACPVQVHRGISYEGKLIAEGMMYDRGKGLIYNVLLETLALDVAQFLCAGTHDII